MDSKVVSASRLGLRTTLLYVLLTAFVVARVSAATVDLDTALPDAMGLDASKLDELSARIRSKTSMNIHSVLVVKNDKLVYEEYFSGKDENWGEALGVVEFDRDLSLIHI